MIFVKSELICRPHGYIEEVWALQLVISHMHCTMLQCYCILTIRHDLTKYEAFVWLWRLRHAKRPKTDNILRRNKYRLGFAQLRLMQIKFVSTQTKPPLEIDCIVVIVGAVERADGKVIVTYFRGHSNWTFVVVTNIDGFGCSRLETPLASTLCNNDVLWAELMLHIVASCTWIIWPSFNIKTPKQSFDPAPMIHTKRMMWSLSLCTHVHSNICVSILILMQIRPVVTRSIVPNCMVPKRIYV